MNKYLFFTTTVLCSIEGSTFAAELARRPATIRYAVIVGSNVGVDPIAGELPRLQHAESEVTKLQNSLIRFASFDPARTILLTGAKRAEVAQAISKIAAQVKADHEKFGETRTLFAFFFTGHGLSERLLLQDGPLYSKELATMFQEIRADFSLGFFDACFSGSLAEEQLAAKGVRPTPGLNIFRELPEETLSTEGSVWFVSSAPTEASYEDRDLGGVFTHFFIEALERAEPDGPGITLERIWNYARRETVLYTKTRKRAQTPQEVVTRRKSSAPLYFSFPKKRDAKLVLSAKVSGRFLLAYDGGELTELVDKEPGAPLELDVYSGPARLIMVGEGAARAEEQIELASGGLTLLERNDEKFSPQLAEKKQTLWEKGLDGQKLRASRVTRAHLRFVGAGYQGAVTDTLVLAPRHVFNVTARWDVGHFSFSVRGGYGVGWEKFDAWSYELDTYAFEGRAGVGITIGSVRLGVLAGLEVGRFDQRFDDGERLGYTSFAATGGIDVLFSIAGPVAIAAGADTGVLFTRESDAPGGPTTTPIGKLTIMPMVFF
jgi:hypothetical protein